MPLYLTVADEDAAGPADNPVHHPGFFQRGQHLAQAGATGAVAFGQVALAAEFGAGGARVDVGDDVPAQLFAVNCHPGPLPVYWSSQFYPG